MLESPCIFIPSVRLLVPASTLRTVWIIPLYFAGHLLIDFAAQVTRFSQVTTCWECSKSLQRLKLAYIITVCITIRVYILAGVLRLNELL